MSLLMSDVSESIAVVVPKPLPIFSQFQCIALLLTLPVCRRVCFPQRLNSIEKASILYSAKDFFFLSSFFSRRILDTKVFVSIVSFNFDVGKRRVSVSSPSQNIFFFVRNGNCVYAHYFWGDFISSCIYVCACV